MVSSWYQKTLTAAKNSTLDLMGSVSHRALKQEATHYIESFVFGDVGQLKPIEELKQTQVDVAPGANMSISGAYQCLFESADAYVQMKHGQKILDETIKEMMQAVQIEDLEVTTCIDNKFDWPLWRFDRDYVKRFKKEILQQPLYNEYLQAPRKFNRDNKP